MGSIEHFIPSIEQIEHIMSKKELHKKRINFPLVLENYCILSLHLLIIT